MIDKYIYYVKTYGNIETEEEFESLYDEALRYMDKITYGQSGTALDNENVIKCGCAICNLLHKFNMMATSVPGVESEAVDGYSVKYAAKSATQAELDFDIVRTCHLYLPKEMLYRGV